MDEMDRPTSDPDAGRSRNFRRNVVAVGAALGLTFGGLGIAAAQTDGASTTAPAADGDLARHRFGGPGGPGGPGREVLKIASGVVAKTIGITEDELRTGLQSGKSVADIAKAKGVDPALVVTALVEEAKARLAEEVKAGRLTQAQADERISTLVDRMTKHVNNTGGPGGRGDHGGPGRPGPGRGPGLDVAAKAIGISVEDLRTALRAGKSIAQVAKDKGVDPAVVIKAMVDDAQAKMAERAATLEARITEHVNRVGGAGPDGPGGP